MSMLNDQGFLQECTHEAKDQIETFLSFGLIPTHMDTHHHVHGFFPIFQILVDLLSRIRYSGVEVQQAWIPPSHTQRYSL